MADPEDGDDFDDIQDFDDTDDQGPPPEDDQDDGDDQSQQADDQDLDDDPQPPRQPSRLERRAEALAARRTQEFERVANEAAQRAEAAERRLQEALRGPSRADAERQERERLERMLPEERAEYIARNTENRLTGEIQALRREQADATDRSEFASACATNPSLARVKDQVETELSKLRANGQTVPRKTLAAYLIGNAVLEKAPKARERAAKRAAGNLDRERAQPAGGASDAPRGREKDEKAARDKRLENYTF